MKWKIPVAAILAVLSFHTVAAFTPIPSPEPIFVPVVLPTSTSQIPTIFDPIIPTPIPVTKNLPQPTPKVYTTEVGQVKKSYGHTLTGYATWYCLAGRSPCRAGYPSGYYAAINWRYVSLMGHEVSVCLKEKCIHVKIVDCIECGKEDSNTLIDLYSYAFDDLAPLGQGIIHGVEVKW